MGRVGGTPRGIERHGAPGSPQWSSFCSPVWQSSRPGPPGPGVWPDRFRDLGLHRSSVRSPASGTSSLRRSTKPSYLFRDLACRSGSIKSSMSFEQRQRAVCVREGTTLTLILQTPPPGAHWGVYGTASATKGYIVGLESHSYHGRFVFVYRVVRTGIDVVHVLKFVPCRTGCIVGGPPTPEAQWVVRVTGR